MHLIASMYLGKLGNKSEAKKCRNIVDEAIQAIEKGPVDEGRITAAASVLNSMAFGYAPVYIEDQLWLAEIHRHDKPTQISDDDFKTSEKLKLRAVKMLDRLPATADARRKAHRDMVLWYETFKKVDLADAQKQTLFELVGSKDDSILYPQSGSCGSLIWWQTQKVVVNLMCGMG
jgi:hypothetical protein